MLALRPFQKEVIQLYGEHPQAHVLCLAPTGSGKSLIYETLALQRKTRFLLMTPLLALARQQYKKLSSLGLPVVHWHAAQKEAPALQGGSLLITSPECLEHPWAWKRLEAFEPEFLVVDECHCVWEWSAGFRPAFEKILSFPKRLPIRYSLWLTATLPLVHQTQLKSALPDHFFQVGVFSLPKHLRIGVRKVPWFHRTEAFLSWLFLSQDPAIVFVATRTGAQKLFALCQAALPHQKIVLYHAGLSQEERLILEHQIREERVDLIIATTAFGMGMDYSFLKRVLIWQAPLSVLSLVQMLGRVTRNPDQVGLATIFWHEDDFEFLRWAIEDNPVAFEQLQAVKQFLNSSDCVAQSLSQSFVEEAIPVCGTCSRCQSNRELMASPLQSRFV